MRSGSPSLKSCREFIDKKLQEYDTAQKMVEVETAALESASADLETEQAAQAVVQEVAAGIQQTAHARIAGIVTKCLQTVFDEPYEFHIVFEQKRGKTEARFVLLNDDRETDPVNAEGGSVVDMAAFALRLAALSMTQPAPRKLFVADEPFRFVDSSRMPRVRELLLTLAKELGFQFVIVTHDTQLHAGKVIDLS